MATFSRTVCQGYPKDVMAPEKTDFKAATPWGDKLSVIAMGTDFSVLNLPRLNSMHFKRINKPQSTMRLMLSVFLFYRWENGSREKWSGLLTAAQTISREAGMKTWQVPGPMCLLSILLYHWNHKQGHGDPTGEILMGFHLSCDCSWPLVNNSIYHI